MSVHFVYSLFKGHVYGDLLVEMQHEQKDAAVCGLSSQSGSGYGGSSVYVCLSVCASPDEVPFL